MMKKAITVFCASADGVNPVYMEAARHLGEVLAAQGRKLIYGAGNRGLMGAVAKAARDNGGYTVGVNITRFSNPKYMMTVEENYVTDTMQERKVQLLERGDACIALPGGIGTLDELTEVLSMLQLGLTDRPMGILNVNGFYDPLLVFIDRMKAEGFFKAKYEKIILVRDNAEELLEALDAAENVHEF